MNDPLRKPSGGRTVRIGVMITVGGLLLAICQAFVPIRSILGSFSGPYLFAFGLAGVLLGLSCMINGAIDWMRGR